MNLIADLALALGVLLSVAALIRALAVADTTPAQRAAATAPLNRNRDASDPDLTILGHRPDHDGIFGTYPSLRVVERLSPEPPVSNPEGTTRP